MSSRQLNVVILSHPRSGTHLLMDFIRRNFPQTQPKLGFWESAHELYISLDATTAKTRQAWTRRHERSVLIAQSHLLGFTKTPDEFSDILDSRQTLFFYPFRRFSHTVKSYADFLIRKRLWSGAGDLSELLLQPDPVLGSKMTVGECLRAHAKGCMQLTPFTVNIEHLIANPHEYARRLGTILSADPKRFDRPLPQRKRFQGKFSELYERLRGRESTEVKMPPAKEWSHPQEPHEIDMRFQDMYELLQTRSIIP